MSEVNAYEPPPQLADSQPGSLHLASVRRTYNRIGIIGTVVGVAYFSLPLVALAFGVGPEFHRRDILPAMLFGTIATLHFLFMNHCRKVGRRLEALPTENRGSGRLVGFAMSALYFPVLTAPGLYCVWRIDKHFESAAK